MNMKITEFQTNPVATFRFLNSGRGPGQYYEDRLPVHHGRVDRLPEGISALVVTSDLQGRELFQDANSGPPRLLGEVVPQWLASEVLPSLGINDCDSVAALLAGDFYTVPALDKRGGTGDVTSVWHAFRDQFTWVAGVPGNHDLFSAAGNAKPQFSAPLHFIDGDVVEIQGLRIGGIGGIIGNPSRPQRRSETDYLDTLNRVLNQSPDVLLMHEGPNGVLSSQRGMPQLHSVLEMHSPRLIIRGHAHWDEPFAECLHGSQILNVDARIVVFT